MCDDYRLFRYPKEHQQKARTAMLSGQTYPTKKPDVDNVVKIVLDALNGFAWHDDAQVIDLHISTTYTEKQQFVWVGWNRAELPKE